MDVSPWLGANHSDTERYREDLHQRQVGTDAGLCFV